MRKDCIRKSLKYPLVLIIGQNIFSLLFSDRISHKLEIIKIAKEIVKILQQTEGA